MLAVASSSSRSHQEQKLAARDDTPCSNAKPLRQRPMEADPYAVCEKVALSQGDGGRLPRAGSKAAILRVAGAGGLVAAQRTRRVAAHVMTLVGDSSSATPPTPNLPS